MPFSVCLVKSRYQGHSLAKELVMRGLQTTVITDSAVFAMISRVNMVNYYESFVIPVEVEFRFFFFFFDLVIFLPF